MSFQPYSELDIHQNLKREFCHSDVAIFFIIGVLVLSSLQSSLPFLLSLALPDHLDVTRICSSTT